ncbi:MAG: hypothetical protein ABI876_02275 [Bacteroidota bacterium]
MFPDAASCSGSVSLDHRGFRQRIMHMRNGVPAGRHTQRSISFHTPSLRAMPGAEHASTTSLHQSLPHPVDLSLLCTYIWMMWGRIEIDWG